MNTSNSRVVRRAPNADDIFHVLSYWHRCGDDKRPLRGDLTLEKWADSEDICDVEAFLSAVLYVPDTKQVAHVLAATTKETSLLELCGLLVSVAPPVYDFQVMSALASANDVARAVLADCLGSHSQQICNLDEGTLRHLVFILAAAFGERLPLFRRRYHRMRRVAEILVLGCATIAGLSTVAAILVAPYIAWYSGICLGVLGVLYFLLVYLVPAKSGALEGLSTVEDLQQWLTHALEFNDTPIAT